MLLSSTDFDIFDCEMIVKVGPPTTYQLQRHNAKSFTFLPFQILYPTVLGLSNLLKMSSTQILCDGARKALKWLWSRSRSRQKQRRQHLLSTFGALKTFIFVCYKYILCCKLAVFSCKKENLKRMGHRKKVSKGWVIKKRCQKDGSSKKGL